MDWIELGSVPCDEECVSVNDKVDYLPQMRVECLIWRRQLVRVFGKPPYVCRFRVKTCPHDFGPYMEVIIEFLTNDEESIEFALKCEREAPAKWDEEALKERKERGLP